MNSPNDNPDHPASDARPPVPAPVRYLTASDLYHLNVAVMDGDTLVRDLHLLTSAARRPMLSFFGQPQFPTIIDKAAALLHSLAYHHLFMDGNKRTAVLAVQQFLALNGYRAAWDERAQYEFILEVAQGQHDIPAIADWLTQHTTPDAPPRP
jgi:death-on-curing protein